MVLPLAAVAMPRSSEVCVSVIESIAATGGVIDKLQGIAAGANGSGELAGGDFIDVVDHIAHGFSAGEIDIDGAGVREGESETVAPDHRYRARAEAIIKLRQGAGSAEVIDGTAGECAAGSGAGNAERSSSRVTADIGDGERTATGGIVGDDQTFIGDGGSDVDVEEAELMACVTSSIVTAEERSIMSDWPALSVTRILPRETPWPPFNCDRGVASLNSAPPCSMLMEPAETVARPRLEPWIFLAVELLAMMPSWVAMLLESALVMVRFPPLTLLI